MLRCLALFVFVALSASWTSAASAAVFFLHEAEFPFGPELDAPLIGPNGIGGPVSQTGSFASDDILTLIGFSATNGGVQDQDAVRFVFSTPFAITLDGLSGGRLGGVELFEWSADGLSTSTAALQTNIDPISESFALFGGQIFSAGDYSLRFVSDPNSSLTVTYTASLEGRVPTNGGPNANPVPLPAPALLLLGALGGLVALRRRRRA